MFKKLNFLFYTPFAVFLLCAGFVSISAQKTSSPVPPPPPPPAPVMVSATGIGSGYADEDEDDTRVTGATVRGRVFYEDTGRPVRFAAVTLSPENAAAGYSRYSAKYVKTDANGEFVLKNVKPGIYLPFVKSEGILTPDFTDKNEKDQNSQPLFEKITVSGLGEIQVSIPARRGGAVSGRIQYADGEAAVGVKVEVLRKSGDRYAELSPGFSDAAFGSVLTDDRGVYRLAGLPAGNYIVRISEPFSHSQSRAQYEYALRQSSLSILKTYYPEGDSSKNAKTLEVLPGQEQSGIDVILPERRLFTATGKIVSKKTKQPLENFNIRFNKIGDIDPGIAPSLVAQNSIDANKLGDWTLKNLPAGKYRLTVSQTPSYKQRQPNEKPAEYPSASKEIEITDRDLEDIVFEIPEASSISGVVVFEEGKPAPKYFSVFAFDDKTKQFYNSQLYSDGNNGKTNAAANQLTFRIGKMAAGEYRFSITNREYYVKSVTLNGRDVTNSLITVEEGDNLDGIRIELSSGMGVIKGKVGNYKPGARLFAVALKSDSNMNEIRFNSFGGAVGENGAFQINAKPGEYVLVLVDRNFQPKDENDFLEYMKNQTRNAPKVTVETGKTIDVTLEMPE